jgi:tetratricopeptide (TPR) repeat protein
LARILYSTGEARERLGQSAEALLRYSEAGALAGGARDTYLAELRAGDILVRLQRKEEARGFYTRVAEATPESEEGKAARKALKEISSN